MYSGYSVSVLIVSPKGIPLVRDPKKPAPVFWKLPGGRSEGNETPEECALREVREELGLSLEISDLERIHEEQRRDHVFVAFRANVKNLSDLNEFGNEGEEVMIFSRETILRLESLFPNHRGIIENFLSN